MFTKAVIAVSLAATALAQTFSIATPAALVQCQPVAITWTGGTGPYILVAVPGGQPSAPALTTIGTNIQSSPYTWTVDLAAGTSVTLLITDSTGVSVGNSDRVIQPGSSDACLNASASTSGIETTGAITTTGSGSATLSATTSATGITTTASSAVSSASSASAAASSASAAASSSSASRVSTSSTPVSASGGAATSAASAAPSGAAAPNAIAGFPAVVAGVLGAVAMLF